MSHTASELLRRRRAANSHGRRVIRASAASPSTPLLRWNPVPAPSSSRKLAAGLWHLRFNEISSAADCLAPQIESTLPYRNSAAAEEKSAKAKNARSSEELISKLRAELRRARYRVRELEAKKHSMRDKVKRLSEKLGRRDRETKCGEEIGEFLRRELAAERRRRRRTEILNRQLVEQLEEARWSGENLIGEYEEERRSRAVVEEVCEKLVQRLGEDKAEAEMLKREYKRVGEELEEERRMLQVSEVWREERLQMKLVDAKIALEDKFSEMNFIIAELETILQASASGGRLEVEDLRRAERILRAAAESLSFGNVVEGFVYIPPRSDDVVSLLREFREDQVSAVDEDRRHNVSPVSMIRTLTPSPSCYKPCSSWTSSPVKRDCQRGPKRRGQRAAAGPENPHITRGMKGCIEWPSAKISRPKNVFKAKISQGVIENQKSQLRHIPRPNNKA